MKKVLFGFLLIGLMTSCVSKKKFTALQSEKDQLMQMLENNKKLLADCNDEKAKLTADLSAKGQEAANATKQIKSLEDQIASLNNNNTNLLKRLEDLSIISQAGAESIKKSLDAMNEKDKYIKNLTSSMARKDSLNLALVMNLKKSLADVNDTDVQIEVKKGVVYISISDKMLFQSGSSMINASAPERTCQGSQSTQRPQRPRHPCRRPHRQCSYFYRRHQRQLGPKCQESNSCSEDTPEQIQS
ncbi:hypothetical protein MASR1M65_32120 [Saprospiraceae bacterium]